MVQDKHLKGLRAFKEEDAVEQYLIISLDQKVRTTKDGITIVPWNIFMTILWSSHDFTLNFT